MAVNVSVSVVEQVGIEPLVVTWSLTPSPSVSLSIQASVQSQTASISSLFVGSPLLASGAVQGQSASSPTITSVHVLSISNSQLHMSATMGLVLQTSYGEYPMFPDIHGRTRIKEQRYDATISTTKEAGYRQTRARFTKNPKTFQVSHVMSTADYLVFDAFILSIKVGTDVFVWVNPETEISYYVRFMGAPDCETEVNTKGYWNCSYTMEEL